MLKQILESILSKLWELIAAWSHNNAISIKDLELTLKILQKNLKLVSAKASDVEEQIKNAELSGHKKRKREVEEWLRQVKFIETEVLELGTQVKSAGFIQKFIGGGKASQLNEEVVKLLEQSRHFGELLLDDRGTRGKTLSMTRMVGGAFEENLERIWRLLVAGKVCSIGVHGMGGAGKTTLAKHIHNRLLEQSVRPVFWVTVSQEFTMKNLQDKIARLLGVNLLDEDDEYTRAARLCGALSQQKSSVLILDDVWKYIDLVKLGYPFSVKCCRLIITTRLLEVCRQIGCQELVAVQKLHEDEGWDLFNETFTQGKEIRLAPRIEEIAKCMARLCDGLPLGIIALAGSMRGARETDIHTWRNALVELKESVMGQDDMGEEVEVFKVLKYSFDQLKAHHQSRGNRLFNLFQLCFLYCSLYPEDQEIQKEELVRKFISEGLLDRRDSRRAQADQGHYILNKLVNISLLESSVERFEGYECLKMHDLVRGMALKINRGKYMVRAGDKSLKEIPKEEEWTKDLEKMSLMYNNIRIIEDGASPNCPNLSTLLLQTNPLEVIPDSFFSRMQGLCTLDLCRTKIVFLPNSLSELKSLKSLLLENCSMLEYVPYLGRLKALRELNLDGTAIKEIPQGVEELLNLKFLSVDARRLEMLPRGLLLKLVRLQYVKFPFHVQVPIEEIADLKQLEEFWGTVENVSDFNDFIRSGKTRVHDTFYKIQVGSFCHEYFISYSECYKKQLILCECNLRHERVLGQDIECLRISKCEGLSSCLLDDFSRLNNPTSLERLRIERCGGIEFILTSEQLIAAQEFPSQIWSFEDIHLRELDDFKGLIEKRGIGASPALGQAAFCSLKRLQIHECNKMRKPGLRVSEVPNLEEITIQMCGEIEEIFEDEGRGSVTLPRLRQLKLWRLPRLKSICKATMICNSIEELCFPMCPRLKKKLPLHLDIPPPPSLRYIKVEREWWESLEWENPKLPHLLHPFLCFG
ncbi:hypothetical protein C2S52_001601 [Perilla frutescens var. hirtella]|nr:hypothetical protein C2S52_001601 [Perilla frutescens var. hirtella]